LPRPNGEAIENGKKQRIPTRGCNPHARTKEREGLKMKKIKKSALPKKS
jgi:hypothetical protein